MPLTSADLKRMLSASLLHGSSLCLDWSLRDWADYVMAGQLVLLTKVLIRAGKAFLIISLNLAS